MLSGKKLLLLGFVVVLLVVIPLTVYLVQQQQKLGVGAAPSTVLSFIPSTKSVAAGEAFTLDVNMAPGGNEVSFIKLTINYDSTKLEPNALGSACSINPAYIICPNSSLFPGTPLQGPTTSANSISITLSVGSNPASAIKTATKIATVGFKAKNSAGTTDVSYSSDSQVLSVANADQFNENVLLNSQKATITITEGAASPSPSPSTTESSQVVCTSFTADKSTSGTAPWAVNFQATGTDTGGTITKVTFNWGDSQSEDVAAPTPTPSASPTVSPTPTPSTTPTPTPSSVTISKNHTYSNPGSFTATAIFTDNLGRTSATGACTKTFTIAAATPTPTPTASPSSGSTTTGGGSSTTQTVTIVATPTPSQIPTPTPIAEDTTKGGLPSVGPGGEITLLGGLGAVAAILGLIILLAL